MTTVKPSQYISRGKAASGDPNPDGSYEYTIGGEIILVEPETCSCQVRCDNNVICKYLPYPGLAQDSEGCGGEVCVPRVGQRVEMKLGGLLGPRIRGYLPSAMDSLQSTAGTTSLFNGIAQPSVASGKVSYKGRLPDGLLSGDWCRIGNMGQHLGVLEGGAVVMCAAPWAKITAAGGAGIGNDTVKIDARNLSITTGFGHLDFADVEGRQSLLLLGGLDQTTETGGDKRNFTVMGGFGEPLSATPVRGVPTGFGYLKFQNKTGDTLFQNVIGYDGSVNNEAAGPVEFYHRSSFSHTIQAGETKNIISKDYTLTVANGNLTEDVALNSSLKVGFNRYASVFGGDSEVIMGGKFLSAQTLETQLPGILPPLPGASTYNLSLANGSFDIDIGKPPTDMNLARSSFNVNVYPLGGNISMTSFLGDVTIDAFTKSLTLSSTLPATLKSKAMVNLEATKINLGGAGAVEPLLKGNITKAALSVFLEAVNKACLADTSTAKGTFAGIAAAALILKAALNGCLSTKSFTV